MARSVELGGGFIAALFGVAIAAVIVALGGAWWAAAMAGLGGLGSGYAAYQHTRDREGPWVAWLWGSALLLVAITVLGVFSIGLFLLPGTLAALVAAGVGSWRLTAGRPAQD